MTVFVWLWRRTTVPPSSKAAVTPENTRFLRGDKPPIGSMRMTPVRRTLLAAAVLVFAASPQTPIGAQSPPKRLVVLLAHADDETAAAPALARYAREGVQVYMLIATDGSGGSGSQA